MFVALVWPPYASADGGINTAPGPCNTIVVFTDTDELQDDIFDHFVVGPGSQIQWAAAWRIDTFIGNSITTGDINCSAVNSDSNASSHGTGPTHDGPEEVEVHAVGAVRAARSRAPVRRLEVGRRYRVRLAWAVRRHHDWRQVGPSLAVPFRVVSGCRVQSNRGCLV